MKVAFVGVKRKYQELPELYRDEFTRYHIELPWYYARDGKMDVTITTVDYTREPITEVGRGILRHDQEDLFVKSQEKFDVVIHWRKWFPEFYRPEALNVINCQDHSFSPEWKGSVVRAYAEKKLYGILCFPKWHKVNLYREMDGAIDGDHLIDGLTLGVDTDIYHPSPDKDPHQLLWASDPGRGLGDCIQLFFKLFQADRRFRLNVCYPDYCQPPMVPAHPGIIYHRNLSNGHRLWDLFNRCGVLPYTSNFMEPSSRAHRQAMAAGSLVLYPPDRGTPSELIREARGGIVMPTGYWQDEILDKVGSGLWKEFGALARKYAISENWAVQARRFKDYFEQVLGEKR